MIIILSCIYSTLSSPFYRNPRNRTGRGFCLKWTVGLEVSMFGSFVATTGTQIRDILAPSVGITLPDSAGKDGVIDQIYRALKLFRRCKMIESELEMQFKLIEYLVELYHSTCMPTHCLRVIEQMRVIHDQVIPLLDDDYCEGVVLIELAQVAKRVGLLHRKETLYRVLAL